MKTGRKLTLLAVLGVAGAFVACTLNPQPLPPRDNEASSFGDQDGSTARSDAGSFGTDPETPPTQDAGAVPLDDGDGGADDGGADDGGDAADSGDAG